MDDSELTANVAPSEASEFALQVRRILDSSTFQGSPLLKLFLEYVTSEALQGRSASISEYSIATRVLGRSHDFDPTSAAVVRTQAYRLRRKLAEYYRSEGGGDPILIDLPKGHYYPAFSRRPADTAPPAPSPLPVRGRRWPAVVLGLVVFGAGLLVGGILRQPASGPGAALPPGELSRFWRGIIADGRPIIIGFTNPVFLADGFGNLLNPRGTTSGTRGELAPVGVLRPPLDQISGPLYFEDGWTGAGEVVAMNRLSSLLEKAGVPVVVKRNRMVSVEDLRNHNVVFVGSGIAVQALQNTKLLQRFELQQQSADASPWRTTIVDRAARPGEPAVYKVGRDPTTQALTMDYAILAVLPGVVPSRKILLMVGLTTSGTQGAAEFATSEHHMSNLAAALSSDGTGNLPRFFESLLRINLARGIDAVNATFVAGGAVELKP